MEWGVFNVRTSTAAVTTFLLGGSVNARVRSVHMVNWSGTTLTSLGKCSTSLH